jgi:hypothetical protein
MRLKSFFRGSRGFGEIRGCGLKKGQVLLETISLEVEYS